MSKSGCAYLDECLAKFAAATLPKYQRQLGAGATPEKLGELAVVRPEAILLALNFQKNVGIDPYAIEPPTKAVPEAVPPPVQVDQVEAPPPPAEPDPDPVEPAEPEPDPDPIPDPPAEESEPEPPDPSAKPKAGPKTKKKKKRGEKGSSTWSTRHDDVRFTRERERSPMIAQLKPGQHLERVFKGRVIEVTVRADHYVYNGEKYPTLYSIVKEVTGTKRRGKAKRKLTAWSAPRFFKLKKLLEG